MKTVFLRLSLMSLMFILLVLYPEAGVAQTRAVRTDVKPLIDGVLESLWQQGTRFQAFKQIEPDISSEAIVKTEAVFLYDNENIYIAMKMFQPKGTVHSSKGRRDSDLIKDGDYVTVALDPLHNGNTAFFFTINPDNGMRDGTFDEYGTESTQWDAEFSSATKITDEYWTAEIQIPLTSLSFQDKKLQDWGIRFYRHYAQNQELDASRLVDIHGPFRLTNFESLEGLSQLDKKNNLVVTPYVYSHNEADLLQHSSIVRGKAGGEIRYMPSSETTILATVKPDYAQIETDKEIINVTDLPTEYPEKRPFFTESSDFYTNAAVNTRNIVDIKAGLKMRHLGDWMKYDVTSVLDGDDHSWVFGHLIAGDNTSYLAELTSGLKNQGARNDYNVTTHILKWFYDKRLSLSNWIGTINNPTKQKNEWETVNNVRWLSRTLELVWWTHYKTKMYNPNIVGWNYLSNEFHSISRAKYSIINGTGLLRSTSLNVQYDYYDLTSPRGHSYSTIAFTYDNTLHLSEYLGNWSLCLVYTPATNQKFRYRNAGSPAGNETFEDAFGVFTLIDDNANSISAEVRSDNSKSVGFTLSFDNNHVRKSKAENAGSEVYWKIGADAIIRYSLGYINIHGSGYQDRYVRAINRLQVEYNLTDKFNIRLILQPDVAKLPGNNDYVNDIMAHNLTISWEYMPGGFVYLVYSKYRSYEEATSAPRSTLRNDQSVVLKINKSFSL